jgi:hypothetical protein
MKQSLLTLSSAFVLAGVSQAAILVDNFESYPADDTTSMQGLGTWTVTNGASLGGPISVSTGSTFEGSTGAALIGGFAPSSAGPTVLSSSVSVPMFTVGSSATFSMDFGFLDSENSNRDDYSISLASTGGNLLTIDLTPAASVNTFNISFSSDYFTGLINWGTLDALDTLGNPFFQIMFETSTDGVGGMSYSLSDVNSGLISSGALALTNLTDNITGLSISSITAGAAGNGVLIIDNVSVVPEPSSALLGLLGASCVFLRRRRA